MAVLAGEDTTNMPALDRAAQGRSCRSGAQQQDHNRGGLSLLCLLRRRVSFVANTRWLRQYPLSRAMERSVLDWADGGAAARHCTDGNRHARRDRGWRQATGGRRSTPRRADEDLRGPEVLRAISAMTDEEINIRLGLRHADTLALHGEGCRERQGAATCAPLFPAPTGCRQSLAIDLAGVETAPGNASQRRNSGPPDGRNGVRGAPGRGEPSARPRSHAATGGANLTLGSRSE